MKMKKVLIAEFYVQGGDMESFLEAERYRVDFASRFPHALPSGMELTLIKKSADLKTALHNPGSARLSMVPFAAMEMEASYSIIPRNMCFKVEVCAPSPNEGLVQTMKGMLGNHGFKEKIDM
jgi:hypothetical protein